MITIYCFSLVLGPVKTFWCQHTDSTSLLYPYDMNHDFSSRRNKNTLYHHHYALCIVQLTFVCFPLIAWWNHPRLHTSTIQRHCSMTCHRIAWHRWMYIFISYRRCKQMHSYLLFSNCANPRSSLLLSMQRLEFFSAVECLFRHCAYRHRMLVVNMFRRRIQSIYHCQQTNEQFFHNFECVAPSV